MKATEQLREQLNAGSQTKENSGNEENTELREERRIPNTPFTAVKLEDKWFLTMGSYRMTETYESLEELMQEEQLHNTNWNLLTNMLAAMQVELGRVITEEATKSETIK